MKHWTTRWGWIAVVVGVGACGRPTPTQYPQPATSTGYYAMGFQPGPALGLFSPAMGAVPTQAGDPINNIDIPWLRGQAQDDYEELSAALEPQHKARVAGIPLVFDETPGEVNAFAACTGSNSALIAVTDGLLDVCAHLAQCAATDEVFGTRKTDEYIDFMAKNQRWGEPLIRPPESFWDPAQKHDPKKIQRQHELYDEEVGFIIGHEMGHHYLGHLPCSAGNVTASEANVVLRSAAPGFNQVNEVGADTGATRNILITGSARSGYHWVEGGALLVMRFFAGLDQLTPTDVVFAFERTHPPAQVRIPIIQQTANAHRASGGIQLPIPIPLPF